MSLSLLIFLYLFGFFGVPTFCEGQGRPLRLKLVHRRGLEWAGRAEASAENRPQYVRELFHRDAIRKGMVWETLARRRRATEITGDKNVFSMPMLSGAYVRTGEYFVRFQVGTPAQRFLMIADTGSDLAWMSCKFQCRQNCTTPGGGLRQRRVFDADKSSSFSPIECSSPACKNTLPFSLAECPTPASHCVYDYLYADGSEAKGFYANESVTVVLENKRRLKLKGVVVGCTSSSSGAILQEADGVLGLGHSQHSFAAKATGHAGAKFSYCLVDHLSSANVTGYLTFGSVDSPSDCASAMLRTPLGLGLEPFYAVQVVGVSAGGVLLDIPDFVWNATLQGGVILDSGSSLTTLAEQAYGPVLSALSAALGGLPRLDIRPFDFCYNTTSGYSEKMVPRLAFHFEGGALFQPHVKSYVIDVAEGQKCIGFLKAKWPAVSMIGNILQQNFLWEFDLRRGSLGFKPSTCS